MNQPKPSSEPLWPFLTIVLAVIACFAAYAYWMPRLMPDPAARGQFGDTFGALNTLFSGLAFAAFAYTLLLQRRELALQRAELAQTREELAKQAAAQQAQAETALRAAEISALGSLLQSYAQLASSGNHVLIESRDWHREVRRVKDRLRTLLEPDPASR
jgi:hypothetical protein